METGLFLGRIPYIKSGSGPRTAVIFFGANALFQRIDRVHPADYARMVANIMPPGYTFYILGYEDDPPADFGFDRIVADFARIVSEQTGRTTIVGVSFGGFVAQRFAAQYPELVDKLVILISAHRFSAEGWRKVERQAEYLKRGDLYGFIKDIALLFRRPWYNWTLHAMLWHARHVLPARMNDPARMLRGYQALFGNFENRGYCTQIQAPTLVVGGTADQFFARACFEETAALIPASRLHLFEDETHMVPIERSHDVAQVIARFLSGG